MAIKPYMTSNILVEAVKRKMAIPVYQITFTPEDILALANEEVFLSQVPSIMQYHEEYFVHQQEVTITANKSRYPIPNRAIGMKLRDLFYKDNQGQLIEMSKISPDDKAHFGGDFDQSRSPIHYYLQNNNVILVPEVGASPTGSLQFTYFLRPNSLVPDERAVICGSFSKTITVDNTTLIAGDTLTLSSVSNLVLTAGTEFAIGANSSITATNIITYIASLNSMYSVASSSNIITVTYIDRSTEITTSNVAAFVIPDTITVNSTQAVPSDIASGTLVDFLQTDGGHSTYSFDVLLANNSVSSTSVTFPSDTIPEDFVVGDYICHQYECIVPQVPTDLHNLLAERTCARILEAQGDDAGLKNANTKIADLEARQAAIIDSRVDGSPMKVFNRHSLLRYGKSSRRTKI